MILLAAAASFPTLAARAAPPAASGPVLKSVRLSVADLPGAVEWFRRTLDWTPSFRTGSRAAFSGPDAGVELDSATADSPARLVLSSPDADADYKRLLDRGAQGLAAPEDRPSGFREAAVRGPGALIVELDGPLASPPDFSFTTLSPGRGEPPGPEDTVRVRYEGTLTDGTVFDGAHRRRSTLVAMKGSVRCWAMALRRMRPGERARFACPPDLAYGKAGKPPRIPPDATLIYDVTLLAVLRY